ncbi:hypothetical protein M1116_04185 [Patescibacteria group bacterium]|nr:hypothetical protein [Patescibacteria group bacterium]
MPNRTLTLIIIAVIVVIALAAIISYLRGPFTPTSTSLLGLPTASPSAYPSGLPTGLGPAVNTSFTGDQAAYFLNQQGSNSPLYNTGLQVNPDNTVTLTGKLRSSQVLPFLYQIYPKTVLDPLIRRYHIPQNPDFYYQGGLTVNNNLVSLKPNAVNIGNFSVPKLAITENTPTITSLIQNQLNNTKGLFIQSLTVINGKINLTGLIPQK